MNRKNRVIIGIVCIGFVAAVAYAIFKKASEKTEVTEITEGLPHVEASSEIVIPEKPAVNKPRVSQSKPNKPASAAVLASAHKLPPKGSRSLKSVLKVVGADARRSLRADFARAKVSYPPKSLTLLAIKSTHQLEVWANSKTATPTLIRRYPVLAASGVAGPKQREGDRQVPEGIYRIIGLNPNSSYHLSMKLNYPNAFDLKHARAEGRDQPGSNIFIHGKAVSIGCLAMGDVAIEQLFTLIHDVGQRHVQVIIAPTDPRQQALQTPKNSPTWVSTLYQNITEATRHLQ